MEKGLRGEYTSLLFRLLITKPKAAAPKGLPAFILFGEMSITMETRLADEQFMRQALELAKIGVGRTSPNPVVGALVVRDGIIIGKGWHKKAGTPHAEIHALREAGGAAKGATLYVTLEPCCHHGRTGPCTEAIIDAKISRVVFAMTDPNPCVSGGGASLLRQKGIEVAEGILASEAAKLNEAFIKTIATGLPFTAIKMAMTLDGKIATVSGHSQWITGEAARLRVHELRDRFDGILVGVGTVIADNPQLTVRHINGRNPIRIIVDSMARTPLSAHVINDGAAKTIIAVGPNAPADRITSLVHRGVSIIEVPLLDNRIDLRRLFTELAKMGLNSLLIEGGSTLNASIIANNLADCVYWFIAPKLIGGTHAPGPIGGNGVITLDQAIELEDLHTEMLEKDLLITGYLCRREGRDVYRDCRRTGYCQ